MQGTVIFFCVSLSMTVCVHVPSGCSHFSSLGRRSESANTRDGPSDQTPARRFVLGILQNSVKDKIKISLPDSKEIQTSCSFDANKLSASDIEFLKAVKDRHTLCFACTSLGTDCTRIAICSANSFCYKGHNPDYNAHKSDSYNNLRPHAVSYGCCDHSHDHKCRDGTRDLGHSVSGQIRYSLSTCPHILCNSDSSSVRQKVLDAINKVDGRWTSWGSWSACSVSCGPAGHKTRTRTCTNPAPASGGHNCEGSASQDAPCQTACPVNGQWTSWGHWSACSVSCGTTGHKTRTRSCTNPAPAHGGHGCTGSSTTTDTCHIYCPVDGHWASWGHWSACSVSCGKAGHTARTRTCSNPSPAHGGHDCTGSTTSIDTCQINCPVDGHWGHWSAYGACSVTCCNGTRSRTRKCDQPVPAYGGKTCAGSSEDTHDCSNPCKGDATWSTWGHWSHCSATCGTGSIARVRSCTNESPCTGPCSESATQHAVCDAGHCPINGSWSHWSAYGACSVTCCNGTTSRTRKCNHPAPAYGGHDCVGSSEHTRVCSNPCNGDAHWTEWGHWSSCPVTCGTGSMVRTRTCTGQSTCTGPCTGNTKETKSCGAGVCPVWSAWFYEPCSVTCGTGSRHGIRRCSSGRDSDCSGSSSTVDVCHEMPCPVDGGWSTWQAWGVCSATCEIGTRTRQRLCNHPQPANGGRQCSGVAKETENCTLAHCPRNGSWGHWSSYSACSVTCCKGHRSRSRNCDHPAPSNGGLTCHGAAKETIDCNNPCTGEAKWSLWQPWTACSVSCSAGTMTRVRTCDHQSTCTGPCTGNGTDVAVCDLGTCPTWSAWFYGPCSVTCGTGSKKGMRMCSSGHMEDCPGQSQTTAACTETPCPVDGAWSGWQPWTACSKSCDIGDRTRQRVCDNPKPAYGGKACGGSSGETGGCHVMDCPHWGDYYEVGSCSVTCGNGVMQLQRDCSTGNNRDCTGSAYDEKPCTRPAC